jgi:hypothetical protein
MPSPTAAGEVAAREPLDGAHPARVREAADEQLVARVDRPPRHLLRDASPLRRRYQALSYQE